MPYIPPEDRDSIDIAMRKLFDVLDDDDKGEFVYAAYCIAKRWLDRTTLEPVTATQGAHYVTRSSAVSILADAHHYFRKDYLDKYEAMKRDENGPI